MALALGTTSSLDKLLQMVVSYSMELLNAERATLFLYDQEHEQLYSRITEGIDDFRLSIHSGIAGAAARSLEIINIPDAYDDQRFNRDLDKTTGYRTRSILAFPLTNYDGKLVGVLEMLNKRQGVFEEKDISLAQAFAAHAGVALERAHLVKEHLEKQRLEDALRIAREIQQRLFPRQSPPLAGFDIACWNRPCDATGGDYCDFLRLDDHRLVVSLGDVAGHGVGPALVSCAARAMLRALSNINDDVAAVTQMVNSLLHADLSEGCFVTAFLGILHGRTGALTYCSAGQGPLLWLHAATDKVELFGADSLPLGILPDLGSLSVQTIPLAEGDLFAILTDGFYEWGREDGELFGVGRVTDILQRNKQRRSEEILGQVRTVIEEFSDTPQSDDLTAIIVKRITAGLQTSL